jgi:hypothetical protein
LENKFFWLKLRKFCWYGVGVGVLFLDPLVRTCFVSDRIGVGSVVSLFRIGLALVWWFPGLVLVCIGGLFNGFVDGLDLVKVVCVVLESCPIKLRCAE